MKIKNLKKQLKTAQSTKTIILQLNNPIFNTIRFVVILNPEFETVHFNKFGVTIVNKITNNPTESFNYGMISEVH